MRRWRLVVLATLLASAREAAGAAAHLTVTAVERPRPGWMRVVAEYQGPGQPGFRVTPTCSATQGARWVVAALVRVFPRGRRAVVELRDDLGWLAEWRARCAPTALALEMVRGGKVLAAAALPVPLPSALVMTPPRIDPDPPSRLEFTKRKFASPEAQTAEAALTLAVSPRVALQLGYARTALGGSLPHDPADGVRTSVRLGF